MKESKLEIWSLSVYKREYSLKTGKNLFSKRAYML